MLGEKDSSTTVKTLSANQLREWLNTSFSPGTAAPWLMALCQFTGEQPSTRPAPHAHRGGHARQPNGRILTIAAACALISATAIALYRHPWNQDSQVPVAGASLLRPSARGQQTRGDDTSAGSASASRGTEQQATPLRSDDPEGRSTAAIPAPDNQSSGARSLENVARQPGQGSSASIERQENLATASRPQGQAWSKIQTSLDNGDSRPNDWIIPEAQSILNHWVQGLGWRGGVLSIRLRTREIVDSRTCKSITQIYQQQFSSSDGSKPMISIESSRHAGKDSAPGFLPVCKSPTRGSPG